MSGRSLANIKRDSIFKFQTMTMDDEELGGESSDVDADSESNDDESEADGDDVEDSEGVRRFQKFQFGLSFYRWTLNWSPL